MSRLQASALRVAARPAPLEDVLYTTVGTLGSGGARVLIDIGERLPLVEVDPGLLERALANVIDNALAWSPPGDVVRVEAAALGTMVDVRVVDHGPGIPVEKRAQVFEAFQRLGDSAGGRPDGVGLGLAVARGFVAAMHGDITIDDTPGGGATVVISIPRAEQ